MVDFTQTHVAHNHKVARPLLACAFNTDGTAVFVGSEDYQMYRVNVADGTAVAFNTDAWCRAIAPLADGKSVVTGSYDGRLIWWEAAATSPTPVHTIAAHAGWIRALAVSPDHTTLASVGNDRVVKVWDLATRELRQEFRGHESHIYNVTFHPHEPTVLTGDLYGNLIAWDVEAGTQKQTWKAETLTKYDKSFRAQIGGFRGLSFNSEGTQVAGCGITNVTNAFAGIGNPTIAVFDYPSGKLASEHHSKGPLKGVCWDLAFHTEQQVVIGCTGGHGGYLLFWKPGEKEAFHQFKLPADVRDIALSPDQSVIAAALGNGHLAICPLSAKT